MSYITVKDGTEIYYKDWGSGQPIVFSHGWPLNSDSWENQMLFLANNGYRTIAHDRRGHGRSSQPWGGNDMNGYADDLAELIEKLDLKDAILFGFSTGGGEVARYVGRHGVKRLAKAGLVSAVPPLMVKNDTNPNGIPLEVFDGLRAGSIENRGALYRELASGPFYSYNRPGAKPSPDIIDTFVAQGMMCGHKNAYDSIAAFSATDFREDLKKFTIPTLVLHGDDDQIVPIHVSGNVTPGFLPNPVVKIYAGAPHGLADTHKDRLNQDLLEFIRS